MKQVSFEEKAFEDFIDWSTNDKKIYAKFNQRYKQKLIYRIRKARGLKTCLKGLLVS